jgi:Putative zinc-finger
MQHPDEGKIHTWLDGELPAEEAVALETHIAECAECAAAVAEARGLIAASSRIVSSLDIVPGDVIPVPISRKRAWYANTQLRAAAAVLVVAGASLIVMQRERVPEMERLMNQTASAPVTDGSTATDAATAAAPPAARSLADAPAAGAASEGFTMEGKTGTARRAAIPAEPVPSQRKIAASPALKSGTVETPPQRTRDESEVAMAQAADATRPKAAMDERDTQRKVAGGQAMAPVVALPAPPTAANAQQSAVARLRASTERLDQVVVTGVATSATIGEAPLREVKSDTTVNAVTTVYEVSPGVQVTLTEVTPPAFVQRRLNADDLRKEKTTTSSGTANAVPVEPKAVARIETVSWSNPKTGQTYTLSGALTREQLTALRKRLPAAKR